MKTVGATVLGGLWALEWAPQSTETNLRCVRSSGICWQSTETMGGLWALEWAWQSTETN